MSIQRFGGVSMNMSVNMPAYLECEKPCLSTATYSSITDYNEHYIEIINLFIYENDLCLNFKS